MAVPSESDVLRRLKVPGWSDVYVLGYKEVRLSVVSQQTRALNLIAALSASRSTRGRLAVVGGGAAGGTVAIAAAMDGYAVTLIERQDDLFATFGLVDTRDVHPHMYEWPCDGWDTGRAGLPVLDWESGSGRSVAMKLREGWQALTACYPVTLRKGEVADVEPGRPNTVHWRASGATETTRLQADIVVLATGFGAERNLQPFGSVPYWFDSDTHARLPAGKRCRFLVSGCGDGACIEFLKLRLGGFHQARQVEAILPEDCDEVRDIKATLLRVEDEIASLPDEPAARRLMQVYCGLKAPRLDARLKALIEHDSRDGIEVLLNGRGSLPIDRSAFVLNRFIVVRVLQQLGLLYHSKRGLVARGPYWPGNLLWKDGPYIDNMSLDGVVDEIIVRHGPTPSWPGRVATTLERATVPAIDVLKARLWDGGYSTEEGALRGEVIGALCRCRDRGTLELADALLELCDRHAARLRDDFNQPGALLAFGRMQVAAETWARPIAQHAPLPVDAEDIRAAVIELRRAWLGGLGAVASARALLDGLDGAMGHVGWLQQFMQAKRGGAPLGKSDVLLPVPPRFSWWEYDDNGTLPMRSGRTRHLVRIDASHLLDVSLHVELKPRALPELGEPSDICVMHPSTARPTNGSLPRELPSPHGCTVDGIRHLAVSEFDDLASMLHREHIRIGVLPVRSLASRGGQPSFRKPEDVLVVVGGTAPVGSTRVFFVGSEVLDVPKRGPCEGCGVKSAPFREVTVVYGGSYALCTVACTDFDHTGVVGMLERLGASLVMVPACARSKASLLDRAAGLRAAGVFAVVAKELA